MLIKKKSKYPMKTQINLMIRETSPRKRLGTALCVGLILCVSAAFGKFGVWDLLVRAQMAVTAAQTTEEQLVSLLNYEAEFEGLEMEYARYFPAELQEGDRPVDCMEVLSMIETYLMSNAKISVASYENNTIKVQLSGITLEQIAELLEQLDNNDLVATVDIYTADTEEDKSKQAVITMNIVLEDVSHQEPLAEQSGRDKG
jgi:hypothetical protein